MTRGEAVIWLTYISEDIGKAEHRALWHYEQVLGEIREMLEGKSDVPDMNVGRWIPCSERLPEEGVTVLVSGWDIDYDIKFINTGYKKRGKWETEESYEYGHEIRVDAWQPLPEPYMEGNNG